MSSGRKYSFSDALFSSTFIHNPVLIQAAGLCAIVAVATTLKTAVLLAAAFFPVLIITQVFACLALKKVPRWIRVAIYLLIGTAIIAGIIYAIDTFMPEISLGAGIYLALTAANSIIALHCEKLAVKTDLRHAFFDSVATALGYAAVIIPIGALREMIGSSTIWGANIKVPMTFPAILMPFGGFLFLAFFAAALKALINKRFPEHSTETEMKIKKTSVIVSKKNLPENLAPAEEEKETAEAEETVETEETVEVEETVEAEDPKEDDLAHFEPLDGEGKFDLSDIFAKNDEDEDDKDYGSVFNRLFDEAKDFDSDEKKEGDK
ncbi:MAG: Rnf-Nqr domain containing protein [Acutalibacteraceae bacterium]|nr:Rnf-Nqr domain containing protein [Acutalibacteraceae bacterium]